MIILQVRQAFEDASGSKEARVLNIARLYKGYVEFRLCLFMAPYASIMPEYALTMSLNMPEHG